MSGYADTLARFARALDGDDALDAVVTGSAEAGLAIYRNNLAYSLTEALMAAYPVITALVGEDCMGALAADYRRRYPQRRAPLLDYGAALADLLADHPLGGQLPYLRDVARLDAAWLRIHHDADDPALEPDALARLDPDEQAAVVFHPRRALALLALEHAVHALWLAHRDETLPRHLRLPAGGQWVLLWRPGTCVCSRIVDPSTVPMVEALLAGATLEAALSLDTPEPVGTLRQLLADRVFTGFHIDRGSVS